MTEKKDFGFKHLMFVVGFLILTLVLFVSMFNLRDFGNPVSLDMDDHFIEHGQEETGANNIVTSIVFDYRGFDTLGEASVLFAAVLGVGVLFDWRKTKNIVKNKK